MPGFPNEFHFRSKWWAYIFACFSYWVEKSSWWGSSKNNLNLPWKIDELEDFSMLHTNLELKFWLENTFRFIFAKIMKTITFKVRENNQKCVFSYFVNFSLIVRSMTDFFVIEMISVKVLSNDATWRPIGDHTCYVMRNSIELPKYFIKCGSIKSLAGNKDLTWLDCYFQVMRSIKLKIIYIKTNSFLIWFIQYLSWKIWRTIYSSSPLLPTVFNHIFLKEAKQVSLKYSRNMRVRKFLINHVSCFAHMNY